ncbi:MAG: penicillin acylase family protein, partial [Myxococcota bacterium]
MATVTKRWVAVLLGALLLSIGCGSSGTEGALPAEMDMASGVSDAEDMSADQGESEKSVEGALPIAGLSAPVEWRVDSNGISHLRCATNTDCFAAQGYVHASNRFAQMDVRRRVATGRVSTLLGVVQQQAVELDQSLRLLNTGRDGTPLEELLYERAAPETKAAVDAYTNGVNAFLARVEAGEEDAVLSEEYAFALINAGNIPEWRPQDSVAVGVLFLSNFVNTASAERNAGEALMNMSVEMHADFFRGWHLDPGSTVVEASGEDYDALGSLSAAKALPVTWAAEDRDALYARASGALLEAGRALRGLDLFRGDGPFGSNSWATAPAINTGDFAILANDP